MIFKKDDKVKFVTQDEIAGNGVIVWTNEKNNSVGIWNEHDQTIYEVSAEDVMLAYDEMKADYSEPKQKGFADAPNHYKAKSDGLTTIQIVDHLVEGLPPKAAVRVGNAGKYLDRFPLKGKKEDVGKAIDYLQDLYNHYDEFMGK